MTRTPVRAPAQATTMPFPLNIRYLQAGWKLLFVRLGRFEPNPDKSAEWNHGAYLAQGLSHCGACHTPRNMLGAEEAGEAYAGAVIDNWIAPALTAANPSPAPWTQQELQKAICAMASAFCTGSRRGQCRPFRMGSPHFPTRTSGPLRSTLPTSIMRRTARRLSVRR